MVYVDHLSLADYRSYPSVDFALRPGVTVFVGSNGQGKTNLVEAIEYLSTLSSHRVASETPLVRLGAARAIVRAGVRAGRADDRRILLEIEINPGKSNRAKLNRSPLTRPRDLVGMLRTVVFSPEDLLLIKGEPVVRRHFIDALVANRWPRMAGVRADYDRVLKQRTTLLRSMSGRDGRSRPDEYARATLNIWSTQLATVGSELLEARLDTLDDLALHVGRAYADIAPTPEGVTAAYRSATDIPTERDRESLRASLLAAMEAQEDDEVRRGMSLVGPHRDDLMLSLGGLPAKGYASHGESWSLALALRLGSFQLLRADGIQPVLVLDDVFAELDTTRRERLARAVADAEQVLVTAAVAADVPDALHGRQFTVVAGQVRSRPDASVGAAVPTEPSPGEPGEGSA